MGTDERDSLRHTWLRRLVTIPAVFALAALAWGALPLWLAATTGLDLLLPRRARSTRLRVVLLLLTYLSCEVLGIIAAGLIWLTTLGGHLVGPRLYIQAHAVLQRWWTATLFACGRRLLGLKVEVEGQELGRNGPLLLLVRHSSMADTLIAAAVVANPHKILLRYVLKRELMLDPCLDLVGQRLPNAFVRRGSRDRAQEIGAVARLGAQLDDRSAVLIYPEGTRFSLAKRTAAIQALRDHGRGDLAARAAAMTAVLPPKPAGVSALLDAAPGVDVVFVEHAGLELDGGLAALWRGELMGRTLHVRLRRIAADLVPKTDREAWLYDEWQTCDAYVRRCAE